MKYAITLLLGLAVGVATAAGLLYVNPLVIDSGRALFEADDVFRFESRLTGELAFASDGLSRAIRVAFRNCGKRRSSRARSASSH
jgi:hypothetical protein